MKIAVVGDIIIDEYVHGSVERISPEAPVPILRYQRRETRHGGAQNVYENIRSLTPNVVLGTSNPLPPLKVRYVSHGHYLLRVDHDDRGGQWTSSINFDPDDIVVVSDYAKGAIPSFAPYTQYKTIVDPKQSLEFYRGAWCIKPNEKEFHQFAGDWASDDELARLMDDARSALKVQHLIVTLGDKGVAYCGTESSFLRIPSQAQQVFDVTGAGDTFTAVLAYACLNNYSMINSIELANRGAGVAVSHFGTYAVTPADLGFGKKETVVFTNGCFDILHRGHIEYLKASKDLGNVLIVGLNSDKSVQRLKGSGRPINNQDDRKYMLEQLPFVDQVIVFDEPTPRQLIETIRPDIITKGGDYKPEDVVGNDLANVVIVPYKGGYSTTSIVEKL